MKYFELMRPEFVPRAMAFYEGAARSRETTYLEFPVRKKDGTEIWVGQHVRPIMTSGRIEGFQGMARDITDRVKAQAELRAERDFVSAILQTAPSLVMVLDASGQLVRFNRACEELAGVSQAEIARTADVGDAVPPRKGPPGDPRRYAPPAAVAGPGATGSDLARQERRTPCHRVDGHGAARSGRRHQLPDRRRAPTSR